MPYLLRIELENIKPVIWREFTFPETAPLDALHLVVNCLFGWQMSNAITFLINHKPYGIRGEETGDSYLDRDLFLDYRKYSLKTGMIRQGAVFQFQLFTEAGKKPWMHRIQVIKDFTEEGTEHLTAPICTDGARNPHYPVFRSPEDYQYFLEGNTNLSKSAGAEEADFDPAAFSLDEINSRLRQLQMREIF